MATATALIYQAVYGLYGGAATPTPAGPTALSVTHVGDSITAGYNSVQNGGKKPSEYAMARLATPTSKASSVLGYPGQSMREFLNQHKQEVLNTYDATKRNIIVFWYFHNDVNQRSLADIEADYIEAVQWAKANGWKEILIVPPVNRTDSFGFAYNASDPNDRSQPVNPVRLQFISWLINTLAPNYGVTIAPTDKAPAEYADNYPANTAVCSDQVHPTPLGALHLGEGGIAEGLVLLGGITLKDRTKDSVFLAGTGSTSYLSSPQNIDYTPETNYEAFVSGHLTKTGGGNGWNSGGKGTVKVDFANLAVGDTCTLLYEEPATGGGGRIFGITNQVPTTDIATGDFCFYFDSGGMGFWNGNSVVNRQARQGGQPKAVFTRVDNTSRGVHYQYFVGSTLVYDDYGSFTAKATPCAYLYSDSTASDGVSVIPNGTITCANILAG